MTKRDARDVVAIILAICVLLFFILGMALPWVIHLVHPEYIRDTPLPPVAELWTDIVQTVLGGLIGYVAGSSTASKTSDSAKKNE